MSGAGGVKIIGGWSHAVDDDDEVDEETTDKLTGEPKQSFSDDENSEVDDDVSPPHRRPVCSDQPFAGLTLNRPRRRSLLRALLWEGELALARAHSISRSDSGRRPSSAPRAAQRFGAAPRAAACSVYAISTRQRA